MTRRRGKPRRRDEAPRAEERRPLTRLEYATLWHLLSAVDFPQVEHFRAQLPFTSVSDECECGWARSA